MPRLPKSRTFESKKTSVEVQQPDNWRQGLGQLKEQSRLLWLVTEGVDAILTAQADGSLPADSTSVAAALTGWVQQSLAGPSLLRFGPPAGGAAAQSESLHPKSSAPAAPSKPTGPDIPVAPGRALDTTTPLSAVNCPVLWVGAEEIAGGGWVTVVLGVDVSGEKRVLAVRTGSVRQQKVAADVLDDLKRRGMTAQSGLLVVTAGSRALDEALRKAWGSHVTVSHCRRHLLDDLASHLSETEREAVCAQVVEAWKVPATAAETLQRLVGRLQKSAPSAAERLSRSIEATLVVDSLGVPLPLQDRLASMGTLSQAFKQAWAWKSRPHGGLPALLSGLEVWLGRTRRLTGSQHLEALSRALSAAIAAQRPR